MFYRIHLAVRDSGGLTSSAYRDIVPRKSVLTLTTNPPKLQVTVDAQPRTTPLSITAVAGMTRSLGVVPIQTMGNFTYVFDTWLDAPAFTRYVTIRSNNTTYTAVFQSCPIVEWRNRANVKVTGAALEKTAGGNAWNGGAASTNLLLSGDGYAAVTASGTRFSYAFGLGSDDADQSMSDIDFALVVQPNLLRIFEKGAWQADVGNYAAGDLLKVAIEDGAVKYYRNNIVLYTTHPDIKYPLRLDTSLLEEGSGIDNAALCGEKLNSVSKPAESLGMPR